MLGKAGHQLKQFGWIHGMACPSENTLFVAEVLNWRVQKLTLHPDQAGKQASADIPFSLLTVDEAALSEEQVEGDLATLDDATRRDVLRTAAARVVDEQAALEALR
jgi:hypothetical protein